MSAETCAAVADQFNRAARAARAPSSRERTIIAAIPILALLYSLRCTGAAIRKETRSPRHFGALGGAMRILTKPSPNRSSLDLANGLTVAAGHKRE